MEALGARKMLAHWVPGIWRENPIDLECDHGLDHGRISGLYGLEFADEAEYQMGPDGTHGW